MVHRLREPFSGLSHLVGALLSVAGLSLLVTYAALEASAWHVVSFSIYGSSMIMLYTSSALYHLLPISDRAKRKLRVLDHIMIFMLIAGTYTPICLVPLRGVWGWSLFGAVWGTALAGILMRVFWMDAPRWLYTSIYVAMGWMALAAIYPIIKGIPLGGLIWLAAGGLFYSVGAVIYGLKRPDPLPGKFGFHEIWHLFVLAGSFCHFWMMFKYILYLS
jgi:hemolysin III